MSSSRNSQSSNETPILHIDVATVAVFIANLSSGNTNKAGKGVDNSDCCIDPGNQQMITVTNTQSHNSEFKKRKRQAQKERKRFQSLAMQQQPVATPATSASIKRYEGTLLKCNKCNYHHNGACRVLQCINCKKIGHTARVYRTTPTTGASQVCYSCGEIGHYYKDCPKGRKNESIRVHITPSRHITSTTDAGISQICHVCGEIGHLKKDCPITNNSGADGKMLRITAVGETTPDPR